MVKMSLVSVFITYFFVVCENTVHGNRVFGIQLEAADDVLTQFGDLSAFAQSYDKEEFNFNNKAHKNQAIKNKKTPRSFTKKSTGYLNKSLVHPDGALLRKKRAIFDLTQYKFDYITLPSGKRFLASAPWSEDIDCNDIHDKQTRGQVELLKPTDLHWHYEYKSVKDVTLEKIGDVNILKVEKVKNPCLFQNYTAYKENLRNTTRNINEQMLFTSIYSPTRSAIYGFDGLKKINNKQTGFYFAKQIYNFRCYQKNNVDFCKILLCRVLLGKELPVKATYKQFNHVPAGYHSLKTEVLGTVYHVVFQSKQIYPDYIITFKLKAKNDELSDKKEKLFAEENEASNSSAK